MRDTIDMAREVELDELLEQMPRIVKKFKAFEVLVRADERNRTWTQEHWTEYERSIAAVEREACAALADKLEWADHKGVASAIRARGNT